MMSNKTATQQEEFFDIKAAMGEEPEAQPITQAPKQELQVREIHTVKATAVKVFPFDLRKGTLNAVVVERKEKVTEDGKHLVAEKRTEFNALLDDGRVCRGLSDLNVNPRTGLSYTNASASNCDGCGKPAAKHELTPSTVHPSSCVCRDCKNQKV